MRLTRTDRLIATVSAALLIVLQWPVAVADDEVVVDDSDSKDCISLNALRRTEVIDDNNILFYMRGKKIYHNALSNRCGGLAREDRFSYRSSAGRLCRMDMIRVLYNDATGVREGNACSLGAFRLIGDEEAEAIKEGPAEVPANPLPMPEPENPSESSS